MLSKIDCTTKNIGFKSSYHTHMEQPPEFTTKEGVVAWDKYLKEKEEAKHDFLNPKNNMLTKSSIAYDKLMNSLTMYPVKGLTGSKNANFYEFLTMGTVPYLVGSVMLMSVFSSSANAKAKIFGKKMALGVVLYGVAKSIAKAVIDAPVRWITGVDVNMPYTKVYKGLPDKEGNVPNSNEHHKVFESVEFTRWDLLYADKRSGVPRNAYFDKIAKKMGLGENLKDSDQEVKPRIKEIAIQSNLVKNIVPYLWAGTGVALAFQDTWNGFFKEATAKFWKPKAFLNTIKSFGQSLVESAKQMYNGTDKASKIGGRAMIFGTLIATVVGVCRILQNNSKASKLDASDVIDKNEKYVVS